MAENSERGGGRVVREEREDRQLKYLHENIFAKCKKWKCPPCEIIFDILDH